MQWTDLDIGDNKYEAFNIAILPDSEVESPREWENVGNMICFHGRYNLGDEHDFKEPDDLHRHLKKIERSGGIYLPLYLYDHSGLAMSTESWVGRAQHAEWDSGQVGYIYATGDDIRECFMCKRISKNIRERAYSLLRSEVRDYSRYLEGDVYGYVITTEDSEDVDSCWEIYGFDIVRQQAMNQAISYLNKISQGQ